MTISTIDLDRKLKERTATAEAVVERVKKGEGAVPKSPEVKAEAKRRAAKPKGKAAPATPKGRKGPKYSEAEKATVKRAEALRGGNISLGPLQAKRVRTGLAGRTPTEATGMTLEALRKFAKTGDVPKEKRTGLKELGASIPDSFAKSRTLAALLAAIAEADAKTK